MAKPTISDTALLVNWARASDPELSRDRWAHLWITPKAKEFAQAFHDNVSPWLELQLCLRNRYHADALTEFENKVGSFTFFNLGAGFTSYPYLIADTNTCIEIDLPEVIEYKRSKLEAFIKSKDVPKRSILFFALDLNSRPDRQQLAKIIDTHAPRGPMFILMEGLLYFLPQTAVVALFDILGSVLPPRSQVSFDAWPHTVKDSKAIKALRAYFEIRLGFPQQEYTWLDPEDVRRFKNFTVLEQTTFPGLAKKYGKSPGWKRGEYIEGNLYLLEKT